MTDQERITKLEKELSKLREEFEAFKFEQESQLRNSLAT